MKTSIPQPQDVIDEVRKAFAGVRLGNGRGAEEAWARDGFYESEELRKSNIEHAMTLKVDVPWEEVAALNWSFGRLFSDFTDIFCYLDPEGFRYHLPASLCWIVENFVKEPDILVRVVWALTPCLHPENFSHPDHWELALQSLLEKLQLFENLTIGQKYATRKFLEYVEASGSDPDAEDAKRALDFYWRRYNISS